MQAITSNMHGIFLSPSQIDYVLPVSLLDPPSSLLEKCTQVYSHSLLSIFTTSLSVIQDFMFEKTTSTHVFSLLSKLCWSKATGLDNISAKLLRECPDLLAESLTVIFNQSLITGIFPNEWKSARVTPLYKNSGKRTEPTNYRPISVIPVVAKVFERIIYDQIYKYLTRNSLLTRHQSGFRSLHSTVTALLGATTLIMVLSTLLSF